MRLYLFECSLLRAVLACFIIGLRLRLGFDLVSGRLVVMHTYLYCFALSFSLSRLGSSVKCPRAGISGEMVSQRRIYGRAVVVERCPKSILLNRFLVNRCIAHH